MERFDVRLGDFLPVFVFGIGAPDNLVVHVREVAHEGHVKSLAAQEADEDIKDERGARMPDMAEVIDGDAADVHVNLSRADRDELFLASGRCIENLHEISFVDAARAFLRKAGLSPGEEGAPGEGKRGAVLAGDFVDTALVTAAFKTGGQKRFDDGFGELNACHARSEAENVGIVMPAG